MDKNTITYYAEDGRLIAVLPLAGGTNHNDRVVIAKGAKIGDWHHCSLHDSKIGMKREDTHPVGWYHIGDDGKIEKPIENFQFLNLDEVQFKFLGKHGQGWAKDFILRQCEDGKVILEYVRWENEINTKNIEGYLYVNHIHEKDESK